MSVLEFIEHAMWQGQKRGVTACRGARSVGLGVEEIGDPDQVPDGRPVDFARDASYFQFALLDQVDLLFVGLVGDEGMLAGMQLPASRAVPESGHDVRVQPAKGRRFLERRGVGSGLVVVSLCHGDGGFLGDDGASIEVVPGNHSWPVHSNECDRESAVPLNTYSRQGYRINARVGETPGWSEGRL